MNLLRKILGLCEHKWEVINSRQHYDWYGSSPLVIIKTLQCTKCGDIKVIRT